MHTVLINKDQLDLINRFTHVYNKIDHSLRKTLKADNNLPFSRIVSEYAEYYPTWPKKDFLQKVGDVRNIIVHNPEKEGDYLFVPITSVVEELERICDSLLNPMRIYPKFKREVEKFQTTDTLYSVLKVIYEKEYSQFPVYKDKIFTGLLTENGISRWLANHAIDESPLIEFNEIQLSSVFLEEEKRENYSFVTRNMTMLDAENQFMQKPDMEALLITETGKHDQALLGIVTSWDIIQNRVGY